MEARHHEVDAEEHVHVLVAHVGVGEVLHRRAAEGGFHGGGGHVACHDIAHPGALHGAGLGPAAVARAIPVGGPTSSMRPASVPSRSTATSTSRAALARSRSSRAAG